MNTVNNKQPRIPLNPEWSHTQVNTVTTIRRENLEILADFLWKLHNPEQFDMSEYCRIPPYLPPPSNVPTALECGAVCCALGWGPIAGIKPTDGMTWGQYAVNFVPSGQLAESIRMNIGTFIFDYRWTDYDNTPQGAAIRIWYYLDHGLPSDHPEYAVPEVFFPLFVQYKDKELARIHREKFPLAQYREIRDRLMRIPVSIGSWWKRVTKTSN